MSASRPRGLCWRGAAAVVVLLGMGLSLAEVMQARADQPSGSRGETLYRTHCASCHEGGVARAPDAAALRQFRPERIGFALMFGMMSRQGRDLNQGEIQDIVRYLVGSPVAQPQPLADSSCRDPAAPMAAAGSLPHWNGWGADITQHRFQPAAMAQLSPDEIPRLKLKWAFGFPGDAKAYAQPTVWGNRVFVGSAGGKVYALDANSGCQRWVFDAGFGVRTAITIGQDDRGATAYFGDQRGEAYALDADSGKLLWKTRVDEHAAAVITGGPTLADGVVYVPVSSVEEVLAIDPRYSCCTFRGLVAALDARTGEVRWRSYVSPPPQPIRTNAIGVQLFGPSGAAIWSAPSIDLKARRIYVTTGDSYLDPASPVSDAFVAIDMATGRVAWSRQMTAGDAFNIACTGPYPANCPVSKGPDFDFGSSPILVELGEGRRALIAGQKSGMVYAIDPDHDGATLWERRVGHGGSLGGVQWGSAADDSNVYVAVSDVRTRTVPPATAGAQKSVLGSAMKLDPSQGGGLFALNQATGEIV